jgi:hypothetical protein
MAFRDYISSVLSLGANVNKAGTGREDEEKQGIIDTREDNLDKVLGDDQELILLANKWEQKYKGYDEEIRKRQEDCENYWLGKQFPQANIQEGSRPIADNLIFEATETFLPEATKQNPEPTVTCDNTEEGNQYASLWKDMLIANADTQHLRLVVKKIARYWSLYFLGVAKISWDEKQDNFATNAINPQKLILDPDAEILEGGKYVGGYVGERRETTAEKLVEMFPKAKQKITQMVEGKMGTRLRFVEWWTQEKVFFTMKDIVLDKYENPHWNYSKKTKKVDEFGQEQEVEEQGDNHFVEPEMPYVFLTVFNLGKHPHDDTSLIYQNLANQDLVNKKLAQIDRNTDNMNNGIVLSGKSFTREQATEAVTALARGDALWVPDGAIGESYRRDVAPALSPTVYTELQDLRQELRNIFGVRGSSAQGVSSEQTVRGKIIIGQKDSSRIGGGISDSIEQVCDSIFNWWVQMMKVYYSEDNFIGILGEEKAFQFYKLKQNIKRKLIVSVKEGSLIPRDELSKRNEAIDLWGAGALDPETLFERLGFADPKQAAETLYLWKFAPQSLFPKVLEKTQQGLGEVPKSDSSQTVGQAPVVSQQEENPLNTIPIQ